MTGLVERHDIPLPMKLQSSGFVPLPRYEKPSGRARGFCRLIVNAEQHSSCVLVDRPESTQFERFIPTQISSDSPVESMRRSVKS